MRSTGGPAFPVNYSNEADGPTVLPSSGMTLRDHFAGLAMQGLLAEGEIGSVAYLANSAYRMADAMLAERSKS